VTTGDAGRCIGLPQLRSAHNGFAASEGPQVRPPHRSGPRLRTAGPAAFLRWNRGLRTVQRGACRCPSREPHVCIAAAGLGPRQLRVGRWHSFRLGYWPWLARQGCSFPWASANRPITHVTGTSLAQVHVGRGGQPNADVSVLRQAACPRCRRGNRHFHPLCSPGCREVQAVVPVATAGHRREPTSRLPRSLKVTVLANRDPQLSEKAHAAIPWWRTGRSLPRQ
jgi:hypothetical protein